MTYALSEEQRWQLNFKLFSSLPAGCGEESANRRAVLSGSKMLLARLWLDCEKPEKGVLDRSEGSSSAL